MSNRQLKRNRSRFIVFGFMFVLITMFVGGYLIASPAQAAPAGYSEYYVPGEEQQLYDIFAQLDNTGDLNSGANQGMHAVIAMSAYADGTTVFYDHWEDGYGFDPLDPFNTADEVYGDGNTANGGSGADLFDTGDLIELESTAIPLPRTTETDCGPGGTACEYDGRDRFYAAGGPVSVSRASWTVEQQSVLALAWELLPTQPFQTTYTIPVGEDLANGGPNYNDFDQAFVIVQATEDGTTVTIDDPRFGGAEVNVVLNEGETTGLDHIGAGTTVTSSAPVQVQFIVGNDNPASGWEVRGHSAVPDLLWDNEYYSPVGSVGTGSDLFLYNPHGSAITINYEDTTGTGSCSVAAGATISYEDCAGRLVPANSGAFVSSTELFWGIGSVDTESAIYDWGFDLVPGYVLTTEYYVGWAPGSNNNPPTESGSPIFITTTADNTNVYIDEDNDGVFDLCNPCNIDRLDSLVVSDPDFDLSGAYVVATNPIVVVWGEDPNTASAGNPYLDMGYSILPVPDEWLDIVLDINKTTDPIILPSGPGFTTTFTLVIDTYQYGVSGVTVTDYLPSEWDYVALSSNITLPDGSMLSGAAAEPSVSGNDLTWLSPSGVTMAPFEMMTVTFVAQTNASWVADSTTINTAEATGSIGFGAESQSFTASDDALNGAGNLEMVKSVEGNDPASIGDVLTYTIVVTNTGAAVASGISISDPLPPDVVYNPGTASILAPAGGNSYADNFDSQAYNNNDGTLNWASNWIETGETTNPTGGDIQILNDISNYQLRIQDDDNALARAADTSSFSSVTLSFDYRRDSLEAGEYVAVEVCDDWGGATCTWVEVDRFEGPATDASYTSVNYDVGTFLGTPNVATFAMRFVSPSGGMNNGDDVYFDNVVISDGRTLQTNPNGVPNAPAAMINSGMGYDLFPGEHLILTFQVTVVSMTETEIENIASVTTNEIIAPLTDNAITTLGSPTALAINTFNQVNGQTDMMAGILIVLLGIITIASTTVVSRRLFGRRLK